MANGYYIENGEIHRINKMYVGVDGKARIVKNAYVGVGGVARLVYGLQLIAKPAIVGTYTYNGSSQTVSIQNLDSEHVTVTGTTSATDANTYQLTFSLNSRNVAWADGTSDDITLLWTIERASVAPPVKVNRTYTYNGSEQTLELTGFDSAIMAKTGTYKATNATPSGSLYNMSVVLTSSNYQWTDGTTAPKSYSWSISKVRLANPVVEQTTFTYSGNAYTLAFTGFDSDTMKKTKRHTATNTGIYYAYIKVIDRDNYEFLDHDGDFYFATWSLEYRWVINKATGRVVLPSTGVAEYDYSLNKVYYTTTIDGTPPFAIDHIETIYNWNVEVRDGNTLYAETPDRDFTDAHEVTIYVKTASSNYTLATRSMSVYVR